MAVKFQRPIAQSSQHVENSSASFQTGFQVPKNLQENMLKAIFAVLSIKATKNRIPITYIFMKRITFYGSSLK